GEFLQELEVVIAHDPPIARVAGDAQCVRQMTAPGAAADAGFLPATRRAVYRTARKMVRLEGFEPPTNGFGSHYSIRLSYRRPVASRAALRRAGGHSSGKCGANAVRVAIAGVSFRLCP